MFNRFLSKVLLHVLLLLWALAVQMTTIVGHLSNFKENTKRAFDSSFIHWNATEL